MRMVVRVMTLRRFLAFLGVSRNDDEFAIAHAAFGNQMTAEMFDFMPGAAQQRHFKAGMFVEMHMQ